MKVITPIKTSLISKPTKTSQGFTLVEIMVVVVIVGTMLALGYQLLKTVWAEQFDENTPLQIQTLFKKAREASLARGKRLSLVLNFDKKTMGLSTFDVEVENKQDAQLAQLWFKENSYMLSEEEKRIRGVEEEPETGDDDDEELLSQDHSWIVEPTSLPAGLEKIYSVSGIELAGPIIYIHFYPNGNSDSVIFKFRDRALPYLFLPAQNIPAVYLKELNLSEDLQEADQ